MWITLLIVIITYIGIAIGRWPLIKSNRATIVLIGVGLLLVSGQIRFEDIAASLDFDTLVLLFAMMVINANLKLAGFFDLAGRSIMTAAKTPRILLALVILLGGVLSALFLNDTICLMFTPLLIETTLQLKRNPIPYLIGLACASNVGSAATITGNPQNMIIGVASGISFTDFFLALAPISLAGLAVVWVVIVLFYRQEFSKDNPLISLAQTEDTPHYARFQMIRVLTVTAGMLVALLIGVPTAPAALLAACLLLISRVNTPEMVFSEVNWSLLVFFAGMFVVSSSLELNGITARLFELVDVSKNINVVSLTASTTLLSNLVSNVPAVLLLKPVIVRLADPRAGWLTLAAVSTLAGNLTLLGSVANLIVAEIAQAWRIELRFGEYTRAGIIITLVTLVMAAGWISLTIW